MAAEVLGKSIYTVRRQLRSARGRLGAKNTTHAVAIAFRDRLID
jgi:DNA-binding CsgD family transcriptional regulator